LVAILETGRDTTRRRVGAGYTRGACRARSRIGSASAAFCRSRDR
jgi:hypothetical protein